MKLYTYYLSSATYRVRIALNLKGLPYQGVYLDLARGRHLEPDYLELNPQGLVPLLVDGEHLLTQSMAILEYLEETRPEPPLLPEDPAGRARVRALAQIVACEVHPLNNRSVRIYLSRDLGLGEKDALRWYRHWIARGLGSIEATLAGSPETGRFCHGDSPTLADVFLVPQVFNARKFECEISGYPTVLRVDAACRELQAFRDAAPDNQPDAE